MKRRTFLGMAAAGAAGWAIPEQPAGPPAAGRIPTRPLGRTGVEVTFFGLGGQAALERSGNRERAVALIQRALDLGVTYFDSAVWYGPSQDYYGEALKGRRDGIFLATKTHDRSRDGSLRLLEDSLKRLRTDRLDLWQLHNVEDDGDLDAIFSAGGALEALVQAHDQKMVRFLGITGHYDPDVLLRGIERFDFDCILMALNAADRHHRSFEARLLPRAAAKGMGIIAMKVPGRGRLLRRGGVETMAQALGYVWSLPVATAIVGCDDLAQLEENVRLARDFRPLDAKETDRLAALAGPYAREASFFKRRA